MDMERYGDYNDVDDFKPKKKSPVGLIIKLLIALTCLFVVGIVIFRVAIFNYYPAIVSEVYFNEKLTEYCEEQGGKINVKTQELRSPYDHPDEGNFFCGHLYVIPEIGQVQLSLRYNVSVFKHIEEKYGVTLDPSSANNLSLRLVRDPVDNEDANAKPEVLGELSANRTESFMMYTYHKLVFDNVDLEGVEWLRLEVFPTGVNRDPFCIAIYENNSLYSEFTKVEVTLPEEKK